MGDYIVRTVGLKKYYRLGENTVKALDGVDFAVKEREFTAIIGKSGSGKSTLLHMIGGLDTPTAGEVYVDGRKLSDMNREQLAVFRRRKVGFVFQSYNLVPDLNVYENVVLPIELRRVLEIDKDSSLEIYVENDSIVLRKYQPACVFCGEARDVLPYKGRNICAACRKAIGAL